MSVHRITILETAPCADTLLEIRQDRDEGYLAAADGTISLLSGSRLRPRLMGTYAGGKATNVARVMDVLLGPEDDVQIELIVFRPDSSEGRYIAELQSSELSRVRVRSILIDSTARFCVNLSDPSSLSSKAPVEFNISPRVIWQPSAVEAAIQVARNLQTDLLVLAGNPPVASAGSQVIAELPAAMMAAAPAPPCSVDIGDGPLALILKGRRPDVIKINDEEYASVDGAAWTNYSGILVVTDAAGCTVWEKGPGGPSVRVPAATVHNVYSTVGAGDSAHAAFTLAAWVWGYDPVRAARYSMAAAAAAVSNPVGSRGITREAVDQFFAESERTA
jgi:fructose-1-phosphate kinase PfkB-like protein